MVSPRNIRLILALLVTAVILGIVVASRVKTPRTTPPKATIPIQKRNQHRDIVLNDAHFIEMRDGKIVWELAAAKAEYDKSGDVAYLNDISMIFEKTPTSGTVRVKSESGEYMNSTRNVILRGKVHIETEEGAQFESDMLVYEAVNQRFKSDGAVTFRQHRLEMTAKGMTLDLKHQKVNFYHDIDANIKGVKTIVSGAAKKIEPRKFRKK